MNGIDWQALMRAGLHGLQLRPDEFWRLSPVELALMLGMGPSTRPLGRAQLDDLIRQFPDAAPQKDESHG